jgi:hypothetical protein
VQSRPGWRYNSFCSPYGTVQFFSSINFSLVTHRSGIFIVGYSSNGPCFIFHDALCTGACRLASTPRQQAVYLTQVQGTRAGTSVYRHDRRLSWCLSLRHLISPRLSFAHGTKFTWRTCGPRNRRRKVRSYSIWSHRNKHITGPWWNWRP